MIIELLSYGLADEATIPIVTHVDPGAERAQALLRKATSVKRNHFFVWLVLPFLQRM